MPDSDFAAFIERDRQALDAIVKGDPEPKKRLYSRRDDCHDCQSFWTASARLAEGRGNPRARRFAVARGQGDRLRAHFRNTQRPSLHISSRSSGTTARPEPAKLRRTRCAQPPYSGREDGEWRIVHRHADPITGPRPPESDHAEMSAHSVAKRYKGLLTETPTDMPGMGRLMSVAGEDRSAPGDRQGVDGASPSR